jgi:uncharacterized protein YndB with AHSA1/START domain
MTKIRATIQVAVPPAEAFSRFTQGLDGWWPPSGRVQGEPQVFLECQSGGRWYERDATGSECVWGRVLAWAPPHGLVLAWQIGPDGGFDPDLHTELELSFVAISAKLTRVSLEHRHLERFGTAAAQQAAVLSSAVGWVGILEGFARHCSLAAGGPTRLASKAPNA